MGRGTSRGWEVHLGMVSVVALLGITLGCIFGAFYLGYYTGREIGFTTARDAALADVAKLPVPAEMSEHGENKPERVAQIYDRLNEPARLPPAEPTAVKGAGKREERPAKRPEDSLKTPGADVSAAAVNEEFEKQGLDEDDSGSAVSEEDAKEDPVVEPKVRVLGGKATPEKEEGQRTLGMLLDERLREVRKEGDRKVPGKKEKDGEAAAALEPTQAPANTPPARPTVKATPTQKSVPTVAPTKAPKETPAEESSREATVRSVLPDGWFAQVAAPKKLSEAEAMVQKLRKAGFAVVVESANVRGENYYRVVVGPEASRVQAERLVEQLKRESSISGNPFVRRVR